MQEEEQQKRNPKTKQKNKGKTGKCMMGAHHHHLNLLWDCRGGKKNSTTQHEEEEEEGKEDSQSSPLSVLSQNSLSALSYHQSLLLLLLLLLLGSVHCALRARAIPTKICATTLPDMNLSVCLDSLFLLPTEGLGGVLGETNSSYRATQFNWPPIICEEAPPQELQSDLRVKDDAVLPPSLPPTGLPARLQRTTIASATWRKGRKGRKEGRMDGWINLWMDENWVHYRTTRMV